MRKHPRRKAARANSQFDSSNTQRARGQVRTGVPVPQLLQAVKEARADLLVVGARGVGRVTCFLLGSVAEGALKRAPVSVLIVR